ncbi:MAG: FMN-binding protein [Deltaproteobacteria bacterium]|nr:FMN-binding protein [Deltaproteobacteria bacterium]
MVKLFSKIILFVCLLFPFTTFSQTSVFLKPEEALKLLFKDSKEVTKETPPISADQKSKIEKILGYDLPKSSYNFYLGKSDGKIDGYAMIDDEVGKVLPITFVTKISPDGKVEQVEIMVYRESHGGEVATKRFLNQFRTKSFNDELRLHGNIVNVSGATLSSHALVKGVRRALVLWQVLYAK